MLVEKLKSLKSVEMLTTEMTKEVQEVQAMPESQDRIATVERETRQSFILVTINDIEIGDAGYALRLARTEAGAIRALARFARDHWRELLRPEQDLDQLSPPPADDRRVVEQFFAQHPSLTYVMDRRALPLEDLEAQNVFATF